MLTSNGRTKWLDSNLIPIDSEKMNFGVSFISSDLHSEMMSRNRRILENNRFYNLKTLKHKTVGRIPKFIFSESIGIKFEIQTLNPTNSNHLYRIAGLD